MIQAVLQADELREIESHAIIHGAAVATSLAAVAGLGPGSDAILIMPIQVGMVMALGNQFGVDVPESAIKSVIYSTLGKIVGVASARVLMELTPIGGPIVRASVAAAVTEAIGWIALNRLKAGKGLA